MAITLRKATEGDAAAAWEIRREAILHACKGAYADDLLAKWTEGELTVEFARFVAERCYVAEAGEAVAGFGAVDLLNGQFDAVFVRPEWMGRGVGGQLTAFLIGLARAAGLPELRLQATLNAAPFYRRCGFVGDAIGTYHSPRGIDLACVPMRLTIASPSSSSCAGTKPTLQSSSLAASSEEIRPAASARPKIF